MCELLAISSHIPVMVRMSLMEFAEHGGHSGPHRDGWGIAYYEGNDAQLIREPQAAAESDWVRFMADYELSTSLLIAHIRKASRGARILANTQPFTRVYWGARHVFAHNGDLAGVFESPRFSLRHNFPLGETDSEYAFCALIDRIHEIWKLLGACSGKIPSLEKRLAVVTHFAAELRELGPANFFYNDGEYLYVHAHRRTDPETEQIDAPGLYLLERHCRTELSIEHKIEGLSISSNENKVILLASVPLSKESWQPLNEGEIVVIKDGRRIIC